MKRFVLILRNPSITRLALAETELLNGSLNLETVFSLVAMDGEMRELLKQEPIEGSATFTLTQIRTRVGNLIVGDSANNSPQTSSLTGTGR